MYEVDDLDSVVEVHDAPKPDIGAPLPHVVADEGRILLAYLVSEPDPTWDGTYVSVVGSDTDNSLVSVVRFEWPYAHMLGPPNDEAFYGHPLARRGLRPYSVFEVLQSSWLRRLERMNSVHPRHDRERFLAGMRHYVFAFHDSTFECIARGYTSSITRGSLQAVLLRVLEPQGDKHP